MNRQTFPSRIPIGLLVGSMLAVLSIVPAFVMFRSQQEPLQAHYLKTYLKVSLLPRSRADKAHTYLLLTSEKGNESTAFVCQANTHLLLPDTSTVKTVDDLDAAAKCQLTVAPTQMNTWLRGAIYNGETMTEFLQVPLTIWAVLALCLVGIGGGCDAYRKNRARRGIQVRGPELVSRWQFNRRVKGDGFPIVLENERNLLEGYMGQSGKVLRIRKRDENKNIICMSDPGGGKTSILMQILDEVERRG